QWVLSTTMLTGASPQPGAQPPILDELSTLHNRRPLPMSPATMDQWLSAGDLTQDAAEDLVNTVVAEAYDVATQWEMYPVDPAAASAANNGPDLIEPFDPTGVQTRLVSNLSKVSWQFLRAAVSVHIQKVPTN